MNNICKNCDTRNRLHLCDGKDGDFKYCFRRAGSLMGLKKTITPFNTLHELYQKCTWLDWIAPETLVLENKPYGNGDNMVLLKGHFGSNNSLPLGYVTVETTVGMKQIEYEKENEND